MGQRFEQTTYQRIYTAIREAHKTHSMSLVIRERQIETTAFCYYVSIRVAKRKQTDHSGCWQGCGGTGTFLYTELVHMYTKSLCKTVWQFLKKLNMPTIRLAFPGIYSNQRTMYVYRKTCTQMIIAALLIIAPNGKCSKYSSIGEWRKQREYRSGIKKEQTMGTHNSMD